MKTNFDMQQVFNLHDQLSPSEQDARLLILDALVENGVTPVSDLPVSVQTHVPALVKKDSIVLENDVVAYAYPVSGRPTHHRVHLADGRSFSAMCGIDALGAAFTFHKDTVIDSVCSYSGDPVHITIRNGRIISHEPESIYVIHVNLSEMTNWAASC